MEIIIKFWEYAAGFLPAKSCVEVVPKAPNPGTDSPPPFFFWSRSIFLSQRPCSERCFTLKSLSFQIETTLFVRHDKLRQWHIILPWQSRQRRDWKICQRIGEVGRRQVRGVVIEAQITGPRSDYLLERPSTNNAVLQARDLLSSFPNFAIIAFICFASIERLLERDYQTLAFIQGVLRRTDRTWTTS
jgi:hypothetical protein